MTKICVNSLEVDPLDKNQTKKLSRQLGDLDPTGDYFFVQFKGSPDTKLFVDLSKKLQFLLYYPDSAYLVFGDATSITKSERKKLRGLLAYAAEHKIPEDVRELTRRASKHNDLVLLLFRQQSKC